MKNFLIYYFVILFPLPGLYILITDGDIIFTVVFIIFYLIHRGFTDGRRLVDKEILKKCEFWKAFIPLYTLLYFRKMYLEM